MLEFSADILAVLVLMIPYTIFYAMRPGIMQQIYDILQIRKLEIRHLQIACYYNLTEIGVNTENADCKIHLEYRFPILE
ncbi:Hypothetical predicted protein [Octopus vulgaris]|uniref:Uncharacterized protein n=1 Tax=Octopus vulgaris TaxID=6645 RepID=A0AA36F7M8_OCTVU|nr:Hypothetical predicted protein [Octopus vulgaris]